VMEVVPPTVGKEGEEWEVELPFEGKKEEREEELEVVPLIVGKEGEEWEVEYLSEGEE
jgi:hypothetical protein